MKHPVLTSYTEAISSLCYSFECQDHASWSNLYTIPVTTCTISTSSSKHKEQEIEQKQVKKGDDVPCYNKFLSCLVVVYDSSILPCFPLPKKKELPSSGVCPSVRPFVLLLLDLLADKVFPVSNRLSCSWLHATLHNTFWFHRYCIYHYFSSV